MAKSINDKQALMSEPSHEPKDDDKSSSDSASSLPEIKEAGDTKFKIVVTTAVLLSIGLFTWAGIWFGGKIQVEIKRQAEVKRLKVEERERAAAARAAARLAEKEQREKIAADEAKAAEEEEARQLALEQRRKEAELRAKARGGVIIKTDPPRATVTLSNELVQKSPATFEVIKLGIYTITIEKRGFKTIQREIEVKKDTITDLGTLKLARETGKVSILSKPEGATILHRGKKIGVTPLVVEKELTGTTSYQLELNGYLSSKAEAVITAGDPLKLLVELEKRPGPSAGKPWENDLKMEFKPVAGLKILFGVDETKVEDFEVFVKETGYDAVGGMRSLKDSKWGQYGHSWKNPGFKQGGDHPVVGVSWEDAKAFCKWLTQRDRATKVLSAKQFYRLPTDSEWSVAVGLREKTSGTPEQKNGVEKLQYPWGTEWPPPEEVGNFAGREAKATGWPKGWEVLSDYRDGATRTSPVGSFRLRRNGLHDMSGSVWEWCEDRYKVNGVWRVLRGGGWATNKKEHLLSSRREYYGPQDRYSFIGFRCVVAY